MGGLLAMAWGQSSPFPHRLLVGFKAADKSFGIRHVSRNDQGELVIPSTVFQAICTRSPHQLCTPLLNNQDWYSESELKKMGIGLQYDAARIQMNLKLPQAWEQSLQTQKKRDLDSVHYTYSRRYLEFMHDHQNDQNFYGELIRTLLQKAPQDQVATFQDEAWFFDDSIIEKPTTLPPPPDPSSSSTLLASLSSVSDDSISDLPQNHPGGAHATGPPGSQAGAKSPQSPSGGGGSAGADSNVSNTPSKGIQNASAANSSGGALTQSSGPQPTTSAPGKNASTPESRPMVFSENAGMNDEILQELRGMHRLLEKISSRGLLDPSLSQDSLETTSGDKNSDTTRSVTQVTPSEQDTNALYEQYKYLRSMSREQVFQKAFGRKPTPKPKEIVVRLFMDEKILGNVTLHFDDAHQDFWFEAPFFTDRLDSLLPDSILSQMTYPSNGKITQTELVQNHFDVLLNESHFELKINIPGSLKKLQKHQMVSQDLFRNLPAIKPAWISAFANVTLIQDISYRELFFNNDSSEKEYRNYFNENGIQRQAFRGSIDGAVNLMSWVLESSVSWTEPDSAYSTPSRLQHNWYRGDARLVKDWTQSDIRMAFGDVSLPLSMLGLNAPPILGSSVNRYVSRRFDGSSGPQQTAPDIEVMLDAPAEVEIYVNEKMVKKEKVSAGKHVFQGIRGGIGENRVRLLIHYNDGRTSEQIMTFEQGGGTNLNDGDYEFDLGVGTARNTEINQHYHYASSSDSMGLSGYLRYGLHPYLTAEILGAASTINQVAGLGVVMQSGASTQWSLRGFGSWNEDQEWGYRTELIRSWHHHATNFSLSGSYISKHYPQKLFDSNPKRIEIFQTRGSLTSPLWKGTVNASIQAYFNRKDSLSSPVEYQGNASYNLSPLDGLNLSFSSSVYVQDHQYRPQFMASVTYFFNTGKQNYFAMEQLTRERNYQPPTIKQSSYTNSNGYKVDTILYEEGYWADEWRNNLSAGWSWSEAAGLNGGRQYSVGGSWQPTGGSVRANSFHSINMGQFQANYSLTENKQSSLQSRSHYLNTRLETSLSFADGLFAIGRPIRQNFVLVKGKEDLSETQIRINPDEINGTEFAHSWGPFAGVYGDLQDYRKSSIQLKLIKPQIGSWLDDDKFRVDPEYKRGYALRVGKKASILVRARLIDETGEPISRVAFTLVDKENPQDVILESFTNKHGYFQAGNLLPGKTYILKFSKDVFIKDVEIKTKANSRGVYNLEDITVKYQTLGLLKP